MHIPRAIPTPHRPRLLRLDIPRRRLTLTHGLLRAIIETKGRTGI